MDKNQNIIKPKIVITRLNQSLATGEEFRIDNISDITISTSLPYKLGDYLTSNQVNKLFESKQFKFVRISAPAIEEFISI